MLKKGCVGCKVVGALAAIGALNWGLVALFDVDLVEKIFGMSTVSKVIYVVIGISGLILLLSFFVSCPCPTCKKS